jgi:hypothetical protein
MHIKKYVGMDEANRYRNFFLCRKDIVNIYNHLMKMNYQLNKKDEKSVNLWYEKHHDDFFFYQKPNVGVVLSHKFVAGRSHEHKAQHSERLIPGPKSMVEARNRSGSFNYPECHASSDPQLQRFFLEGNVV